MGEAALILLSVVCALLCGVAAGIHSLSYDLYTQNRITKEEFEYMRSWEYFKITIKNMWNVD